MRAAKRAAAWGTGAGIVVAATATAAMQRAYAVPEKHRNAQPGAKTAVVIGGGVAGFATARELARSGLQVRVLESAPGPAQGATAVTAGHLSTGAAWAAPRPSLGMWMLTDPRRSKVECPDDLVKSKFVKHTAWLDWNFLAFGFAYAHLELKSYWDAPLLAATARPRIDDCRNATLNYLREEGIGPKISRLAECGVLNVAMHTVNQSALGMQPNMQKDLVSMNAAETVAAEPGFGLAHAEGRLRGSVFSPSGGVADCAACTAAFAFKAEKKYKMEVSYGVHVKNLLTESTEDGPAMAGVKLRSGEVVTADLYVLAAGVESPELARKAGLHLPITAMRGYKLIVPAKRGGRLPKHALAIFPHNLYVTPIMNELHFADFGEFAPRWDRSPTRELEHRLEQVVLSIFPQVEEVADWDKRHHVFGKRPQTPDALPIVGPTRVAGLYVNSGHGMSGWRDATHSAQLLANGLQNGFDSNGVYDRLLCLERFQPVRPWSFGGEAPDPLDVPRLSELGKDLRRRASKGATA